jgi:hypothetical protein
MKLTESDPEGGSEVPPRDPLPVMRVQAEHRRRVRPSRRSSAARR